MDNKQQIQEALEELADNNKEKSTSKILEDYLNNISLTGKTEFTWSQIKPLVSFKMDEMIDEFQAKKPSKPGLVSLNVESVTFEEMKKRLHSYLDIFNGIPFTIQRLSELLCNEKVFKQYKNVDKYMRGLEKNLMIVTTIDPFGRRIVSEPKVTNGLPHETSKNDSEGMTTKTELSKDTPTKKSTASWFSCLSDVVESPNSYPSWNHPVKTTETFSSQFKRFGNGDLKDPDSNTIFSSKFKTLTNEEDFETSQPINKVLKLDEDALKEEEMKKSNDKQQATPLLSELLNSTTGSINHLSTHPPLSVICNPLQDKKSLLDKKCVPSERKSPILATSTHQGEGVPTNVVHPLQKSEFVEDCIEEKETNTKDFVKTPEDFDKDEIKNEKESSFNIDVPEHECKPDTEIPIESSSNERNAQGDNESEKVETTEATLISSKLTNEQTKVA